MSKFEVGKVYKSSGNSIATYECLCVTAEGWLYRCRKDGEEFIPTFRTFKDDKLYATIWTEVKPKIKKTYWIRVWENGQPTIADYPPTNNPTDNKKLANIKVDLEFEEGEGL